MLPFWEEFEVVSFGSTMTRRSMANAPGGNIDRLSERAVTFCACDLGHIVFDCCLVDQQGRAFARVDERIARHRVARETVGQNRSVGVRPGGDKSPPERTQLASHSCV